MRELNEGALLAGRYVLVRRIGRGGMAEIWLADDRRSESRVALKFAASGVTEILQREWRIGSRLMHANIIRVFEFHDDPDGPFYGMQYIAGPEISVLTGTPVDDILRPIGLIADALRYAHAKDLIHRDIKASNILLDARGTPYLVDFGVSTVAGAATDSSGSAIAASPQQQSGQAPAASDDIYALGVLIAELVCGHPPAAAERENTGLLRDHHGNALPTGLRSLIDDMLSADAATRPTAEQVKQRLADAGFAPGAAPAHLLGSGSAASLTVSAESIRPLQRNARVDTPAQGAMSKRDGVSPAVLFGGLAVLLLILIGVVFVLPPDPEPMPAESTEPERSQLEPPPASADENIEQPVQATEEIPDEETTVAPRPAAADDQGPAGFSENVNNFGGDTEARIKAATDEALGDLLSKLERLQFRAVDRWGGQSYLDALDVYAAGDRAFLSRDYAAAGQRYLEAIALIDPLFGQIDIEFEKALAAAKSAFADGDHLNAVRHYDLAAAISPSNPEASSGLARALNLKTVLDLVDQALQFEADLELEAAAIALQRALELDPAWQPAITGLARVMASLTQFSFEQRMTEGLDALAGGDYGSARAAFNAAKALNPQSRQPLDGLTQVDQGLRLESIRKLEFEGRGLEQNEEWESAIGVYEQLLEVDGDLQLAQEGLVRARERAALHVRLNTFIDDPDALSAPATMQAATRSLLEVSRVTPMGPRLEDQKNTLSRLLKRAATPLSVHLVSDNATNVAIYQVAKLGAFQSRELSLRPGVYVAVGNRAGYRDVRIEFRVAPEVEMKPIVVQCEEQI